MATALAAASWLRPDPLEAIPEVEGIVGLAYAVSPVLALLAVVVLVATLLAPAYFLTAAATTLFGAFPMPLLGVGMSPILGFWLGVGLLAATLRQSPGGAASPASGS